MKAFNPNTHRGLLFLVFALILQAPAFSQTCPATGLTTLGTYPNTYYPPTQASAPSGSSSITLGRVGYGTHSIVAGDVLLIMQMQGAAFDTANSSSYGDGTGTGHGYLNDANLLAGNFEYIVANSNVPTTGGTLTLTYPLKNSYKNQAFSSTGSTGQYTYQVIYVPMYYDLQLAANLTVPTWNGSTGGVMVLVATDYLNFNWFGINGSGSGFRGGATRQLSGGSGDNPTDYVTTSTINNNAGKGEGIAGTPRFINFAGSLGDYGSTNEGYPNGAEGRGAPGTGGGGGTDYDPSQNDQNSGGGGGSNVGAGGGGGNSWSSNQPVGGIGGAAFAQVSPSRLIMGGGGGGGTSNNGTGGSSGIFSSGVAGGGIVIIYAGSIQGNGSETINVSGQTGYSNVQNDGSGGGGAGGSVLIYTYSASPGLAGLTVTANGGTGGSNTGSGAKHGPGGGGGGGAIYSNLAIGTTSATGGSSGTTYSGSTYGATSGSAGVVNQNVSVSQRPGFPAGCAVLPVNFISFGAQPVNGDVALNWVVESQTATGYVVERSVDGNSFEAIGTLPVHDGNNPTNNYTYNDNNASSPTGTLYYRIREEDATGQKFYSTIATVTMSTAAAAAGVYPNPATGSFTLTFTSSAAGAVTLRLFDLGGRLMLTQPFQASTGENAVTVNGLGTLPDGVYILQWFDGLKPWTSKVMIRH